MEHVTKIDERFVVNLKGKQFVTYEGLLDVAHKEGLISIEVDLLQIPTKENNMTAIAKATAKTKEKTFTDIGDASPKSVNSQIQSHIIRMASTRAKARALRDLTNIGMTALEELGEDEVIAVTNNPDNNEKANTTQINKPTGDLATEQQLKYIHKLMQQKNYSVEQITKYIKERYGKSNSQELTKKEASEIIQMLNRLNEVPDFLK